MQNINDLLLYSRHFKEKTLKEELINFVGQKAKGLLSCKEEETLPFIIITFDFFKKYTTDKENSKELLSKISNEVLTAFNSLGIKKYIVRSSARIEGFEERGFYESIINASTKDNLKNAIDQAIEKNIPYISTEENDFAIIIQEFVTPKLLGHLSNERRVSRNKSDWFLEIVDSKGNFVDSVKFSTSKSSALIAVDYKSSTKTELINQLKSFASNSLDKNRIHYEWIWSGKRFWIVQKDIEDDLVDGTEPGSEWTEDQSIIGAFIPKILKGIESYDKKWKKLHCVETFGNCSLPQGKVYALDDTNVIKDLIDQKQNPILTKDLEELLKYPIVIRMDIAKSDAYKGILLPRTETIFSMGDTYKFLFKYAKEFSEQKVKEDAFCFLIHRFIISKSCALAYAKPGIPRVRIDSTWGIVDGLYYHPHDSFEYNQATNSNNVKKKIRCKTEYLDVDRNGKWFSKKSGTKWDWAESLNSGQLKEISKYTTTIADFLGKPVTVMYFVDVDKSTGYPTILPWFYTTEEIPDSSEKFTDVIFSGIREIITSSEDFERLKKNIESKDASVKFSIKLKLTPDILREKHFIEEIGNYCHERDISVELDGSILSHTYYILRKCGAKVKCIDPFDPKYPKQAFYKLVRDKIPIIIESKGEAVKSYDLDANELLKFLKQKAIEEAYEFFWENDTEKIVDELADIYEVIRSTCKIFEISMEELTSIADKKADKKGGFEKGTFLIETAEQALIKVIPQKEDTIMGDLGFEENINSKPEHQMFKFSKRTNYVETNGNNLLLFYQPMETYEKENNTIKNIKWGTQNINIEYTKEGIVLRQLNEDLYYNPNQLKFDYKED